MEEKPEEILEKHSPLLAVMEAGFWKQAFQDEQKRADDLRMKVDSLTSELSSALESYNRECKRNEELQCLLQEILNYDYDHLRAVNVSALTADLSDKIKSALISKHQPIKKDEN